VRVLITGGSKGIGLAIAQRCKSEGHLVCTMQRNESEAGFDSYIPSVRVDLAWPLHMVRESTHSAIKFLGGLDWLVLAGGMGAYMGYLDFDPEKAMQLMKVNYFGPRFVLHSCLKSLYRKDGEDPSRVLWLGSAVVNAPGASGLEDYAATKGAAHGAIPSLARHYARWGVRINVLSTSWVATPMTDAIEEQNPKLHERIVKGIPVRRMAGAEEAADAAYAVLDGPAFWHGDVIPFTGGAG